MSNLNVNWDELPEWVKWVAQDENGRVFGYDQTPYPANRAWLWKDGSKVSNVSDKILCNVNWRNTLTQRPENSVSVDPEVLKALNKRIRELEAQVEALTPKPETETVKVYFYKHQNNGLIYPSRYSQDFLELYAIKEVTVTKGEGL